MSLRLTRSCLVYAGINTLIEVLRDDPPPEMRSEASHIRLLEVNDHPLAVLWEVVADANIEEMRGAG